jgi:hypothetical protein
LKKNARQKPLDLDDDKEGGKDDEVQVIGEGESRASHLVIQPNFGTALKRRLSAEASQSNQPVSKSSRLIASMLRKAPEEVVRERHCKSSCSGGTGEGEASCSGGAGEGEASGAAREGERRRTAGTGEASGSRKLGTGEVSGNCVWKGFRVPNGPWATHGTKSTDLVSQVND